MQTLKEQLFRGQFVVGGVSVARAHVDWASETDVSA